MRLVRHSDQPYQSAWQEWDSGNTTIPDQILQYMQRKFWVYDSDSCGDETIQFVVRENDVETYWQVKHTWWIDYDPEWDLKNQFDVEQISCAEFTYPRINRNWLKLT